MNRMQPKGRASYCHFDCCLKPCYYGAFLVLILVRIVVGFSPSAVVVVSRPVSNSYSFYLRPPLFQRIIIKKENSNNLSPTQQLATTITTTRLHGVLSRSVILQHSKPKGKSNTGSKKNKQNPTKNAAAARWKPPETGTSTITSTTSASTTTTTKVITRTFLLDALEEAMYRQQRALECLESERTKRFEKLAAVSLLQVEELAIDIDIDMDTNTKQQSEDYYRNGSSSSSNGGSGDEREAICRNQDNNNCSEKAVAKNDDGNPKIRNDLRTTMDAMDARRFELRYKMAKLEELRRELQLLQSSTRKTITIANNDLTTVAAAEYRFREILSGSSSSSSSSLPFPETPQIPCPILDRPKETWKIYTTAANGNKKNREFGRPHGFTGPVFYSPLGVPILVGSPNSDSDKVLRRISQGSDLWFQVEDYDGSRVLLRTGLVRGAKNSKRCIQMAADLAAFYSVWGGSSGGRGYSSSSFHPETVPVMYTDSKHVAKRGSKAGRMRKRKSLGRLIGRPSNVEEMTFGSEL
mmetsp:Transcript_15740/g.32238  ORF Transcript_15740/g.32238 Transcript_15740/m.32238 type:complete len:523 (+) Transcript_15740:472-2040(+)